MLLKYVGRHFLIRFLGLLIFFVILLQMLDLLNNSSDVLAPEGAGWTSIAKYISLRSPQLISQFAPFAALLAIVITLSVLNHQSEITIMRAAGMSVHRVLYPIGFACLMVALAHFAFHESVVINASERFAFWEANDYAIDLPADNGTRTNVRMTYEGTYVKADSAARLDDTVRLQGVKIEQLDPGGLTSSVLTARTAIYKNGRWRLFGVIDHDVETMRAVATDERTWETTLNPDLLFALSVEPDRTTLGELISKIRRLGEEGADPSAAATSFFARFSKPMSTLVMPLLGAIAGFGVSRQGAQLARAITGAALGFGYFVVENMALAFGKLGVFPALLGAFFPLIIFTIIGFTILLRMEN